MELLLTLTEFFGRFHPVVVHLPIGVLLLALLLQVVFRKEQHTAYHRIMKIIWLTGLCTSILAAISGFLLSVTREYEDTAVALHMWMGIAVVVLSLLVCARMLQKRYELPDRFASAALLFAILLTGHFGGSLTHGPDYLTASFNSKEVAASAVVKPINSIPEAKVYSDIVQPILQAKCYSCHGAQKQKGRLRVDNPEFLMSGGKNGVVVVPGAASESELVKRLLLPKSDKKHMPPKQKDQLSDGEIALLQWWVDQGATFHQQVKDLQVSQEVSKELAALQKKSQTVSGKAHAMVPDVPAPPADPKAINRLRDKGVVVVPVAQNSNWLSVNMVNAISFTDQDMQLLLPLKIQLVWLKAGNTNIGNIALEVIGQCSNLTILQLNHTKVTDQSLGSIAKLKNLQSLNLVGTAVTLAGIVQLKPLQQLQSIYLFQSGVRKEEVPQLQKLFPRTMIDAGGYEVPTLPSDTMEVKPLPYKN